MIVHVTRKQLDVEKYDECIMHAFNSRIYASSWYLDSVCDDWDVLVEGDYKVVMPLPKRKKYGIYYIYQVPWIQQLGIFSIEKTIPIQLSEFIHAIPKKFKLIDIFLNTKNRFASPHIKKRSNYILALDASFEKIKKGYHKNRKRISNASFTDFNIDKNGNRDEFLNLYKNQNSNYKTHNDSFEKLEKLVHIKNESIYIWNVFKENTIVAGLCWLKDQNRIIYLAPIATLEAKNNNIPTFIINQLIKAYENSDYILDFEGSMIGGVAQFYKSFGAEIETYYHLKQYRLF